MRWQRPFQASRCGAAWLWLALGLCIAGSGVLASGDSVVAEAVQRQDKAALQALLKKRVDVNTPQSDGMTALHWAAYLSDAETATALIRAGAKVNVRNDLGVTPLALAAQQGSAAIIEQLLKAGASPNDPLNFVNAGETPLMQAARTGSVDAVKALARAGADLNANETWNGQTALMWAAAEGHGPVVETLLALGADLHKRSKPGTTPFMFAVRKGDMRSVQAMLAAGADVNETRPDLTVPLLLAILNGHEDVMDLLLNKGADPNHEGGAVSSAFIIPHTREEPTKVVLKKPTIRQQMLSIGGGGESRNFPNTFGRPLQAAIEIANFYKSHEFISSQLDELRMIKSLVAHGADVNGRNTYMEPRFDGARYRTQLVGATAFLVSAKMNDLKAMRLLLQQGADPRINTDLNITPLMVSAGIAWASNQDHATEAEALDVVKMLVEELHFDVNAADDIGQTAMHAAAYRGGNSIIQYLFDKGGKLDVVDIRGRTPLWIAQGVDGGMSFTVWPETSKLLRKLGAKEIPCPGFCPNIIESGMLPAGVAEK